MYNQEQLKVILGTIETASSKGYDPALVLEAMKLIELIGVNEKLEGILKSIQNLSPDPNNPIAVELREAVSSLNYMAARIEEK